MRRHKTHRFKDETETQQDNEDDDGDADVVTEHVTAEFYIRH